MPAVLGYWDIRGLAQPIRLLLSYVGERFDDFVYTKPEEWKKAKHNLGLPLPNLPYYIDGNVKITQSNAIMRYIARKHNMCGQTEEERVLVDMMENEAMDFRNLFVQLCYDPNFANLKGDFVKNLPERMKRFENMLANKHFFAGDKITFVDFRMYELLDQHTHLVPDLLKDYPNLRAFQQRFEDLPAIKSYMKSDKFKKRPLNGDIASFGGSL